MKVEDQVIIYFSLDRVGSIANTGLGVKRLGEVGERLIMFKSGLPNRNNDSGVTVSMLRAPRSAV